MTRLADITQSFGIILFTERFEACVGFYRDVLGLAVWFEKPGLCCLRYGDGYLMVETDGTAAEGRKTIAENPTILRFNVPDLAVAAEMLAGRGVQVERLSFDWGVIGKFCDPDGNACQLLEVDNDFAVQERR